MDAGDYLFYAFSFLALLYPIIIGNTVLFEEDDGKNISRKMTKLEYIFFVAFPALALFATGLAFKAVF